MPPYIQSSGKVIDPKDFKHVMAITLDPRTSHLEGVIRCIKSREGQVDVGGYIDHSVLHKIKGDSLESFEIGDELIIKNQKEILQEITEEGFECLGFEDPDIWIDEQTHVMHLYFTIPLINKSKNVSAIYLGYAFGKDLDNLIMTLPVLGYEDRNVRQKESVQINSANTPLNTTSRNTYSAKEVSFAPINKKGVRLNLVESGIEGLDFSYSVVRVAIAEDPGKPWKFDKLAFHPADHNIPWIAGHASPGPLLPETFINIGEGKRLGIMNGRESNKLNSEGKIGYGVFSIGLFIYDFEEGVIDWVSPEPLIRDTEAKTITFASQFVEKEKGIGTLYAHIDDSFVRAYTLHAESIKVLLP